MRKLMKLELRRNNIRTYMTASIIIAVIMTGFLYLFAYAPMLEPKDKDMEIFSGYGNLIPLFGVLNMTVFCVLSAVMHSKFVIEDYSGKRPILLFSYPVDRKKVMLSKLSVVSLFTVIAMTASNLCMFLLFGITEQFFHFVNEDFTFTILLRAVENTLVLSFAAAGIGTIGAGVGFIKKSVPSSIVSAMLIASLMCNIAAARTSGRMVIYIFALVMIFAGILCAIMMMKKADSMEVE